MASILLEQERSVYEAPKIDLIEVATQDVVCASEGGDNWGDWM